MTGAELAGAAEALQGAPFRLHGRDPATGLDCIGVLAAALSACGRMPTMPSGYRLRAHALPGLARHAAACGFGPVSDAIQPGDALMVRAGPCHFHLLVATSAGRFVHADARLRRVVRIDRLPGWPIVYHWRLLSPEQD